MVKTTSGGVAARRLLPTIDLLESSRLSTIRLIQRLFFVARSVSRAAELVSVRDLAVVHVRPNAILRNRDRIYGQAVPVERWRALIALWLVVRAVAFDGAFVNVGVVLLPDYHPRHDHLLASAPKWLRYSRTIAT